MIQAILQLSRKCDTRRIAYRTFVLFVKATALKACDACLLSKMLFAQDAVRKGASVFVVVAGWHMGFVSAVSFSVRRALWRGSTIVVSPFQGRQDIRQCLAHFIHFHPRRLYPRSSESDFVARSRQPVLMNDFVCSFHQMVVVLAS